MCTNAWNTAIAYGVVSIGMLLVLSVFMFKYYALKSDRDTRI
jgi:hypothetical protein